MSSFHLLNAHECSSLQNELRNMQEPKRINSTFKAMDLYKMADKLKAQKQELNYLSVSRYQQPGNNHHTVWPHKTLVTRSPAPDSGSITIKESKSK